MPEPFSAVSRPASSLSITEKVGYSLGDCAANFVFQTQLIFLMSFYTDVLGIAASTVGTIFLVSRLFDAVNDPIIGMLADRTQTRWGKYRPWVLLTAGPFAVCFVLAYSTPDYSQTGMIIWAFVTYNLLMIIYTTNNIPYSALTGVITSDSDERTSLVCWRFLMAMTAAFFVQTFTPDLVDWFGASGNGIVDEARGYQLTITLWAALALSFFIVTFLTTRERISPDPSQRSSVRDDLNDLLHNRTWAALGVATIFVFVYLSMRGSVTPYYFDYFVDWKAPIEIGPLRLQPMGWFNGLGLLSSMIGILFSRALSVRLGKRNAFRGSLAISGILTAGFYVIPANNLLLIIGTQVALQFVYGVSIPLLWAMMADVADLTEWKTGRRATAMTFAATVFALKLGLSLGGAIAGWVLEASSYVPKAESQTEQAIQMIRLMMSVGPALAFGCAVVALAFYQVNRAEELQIGEDLRARRTDFHPVS